MRAGWILAAAAGLLACRGERADRRRDEGVVSARSPLAARSAKPCGEAPSAIRGRSSGEELPLRLFVGHGTRRELFARVVEETRSYYATLGVSLVVEEQTIPEIDVAQIFEARPDDLAQLLRDAGIGAGEAIPASVQRQAVSILSAKAQEIVRSIALPPRPEILVVWVRRIIDRGSPLRSWLPHLAGWTLPGGSVDQASSPLAQALGLGPHTPVIFLAEDDLPSPEGSLPDTTLAHEIGHALGLAHEVDAANLMASRRRPRCLPGLSESQLRRLERGLAWFR